MSERKDHRDEDEAPEPGAEVIPLRASDAGSITAFDEGRPDGAAYLDVSGTEEKRRAIIPEHLTRSRLPETLGGWAGRTWYQPATTASACPGTPCGCRGWHTRACGG